MSASHVGERTLESLQAIVGKEHVREGHPEGHPEGTRQDAVQGVPAGFVVCPASVQEAADVMKAARRDGLAVIPRGAGSKVGWGGPPRRADVVLSTERLNRILEHAAGDLVVQAQAGVPLEQLQSVLAGAGQRLALDPPESGATLGGIIAANASGPLRLRFGTARDLLIGVTYILPDGTVARAGGKVVKNVAGYDLCKLFTGSLGTLGLVAEATFRLHPLPAATGVVVAGPFRRYEELSAAVQAVMHSNLVPSALEMGWDAGGSLMILFEGVEPGVEAQIEAATSLLQTGQIECKTAAEAERVWREAMGASPRASQTTLKVSAPVAALPHVLAALHEEIGEQPRGAGSGDASGGYPAGHPEGTRGLGAPLGDIRGHAASGITLASVPEADALPAQVQRLRERLTPLGASVVVQNAPPEVARKIDVWGPVGDALPLMQRVKALFDPDGRMNPGRFVGGL